MGDWKLKLLEVLEYQYTVREIVFVLGCVAFLRLSWEFAGKIINRLFPKKLKPWPIFWPEEIEALAKIMREDGESEEEIKRTVAKYTKEWEEHVAKSRRGGR